MSDTKDTNENEGFKVKVEETESSDKQEAKPEKTVHEETRPSYMDVEGESPKQEVRDHEVKHYEPETPKKEQAPPQPISPKKEGLSFVSIFIAFILSLVMGGLLVGGIFYFNSAIQDQDKAEPTPAPTLSTLPTPEPTQEPVDGEEIDPADYSVQILNGSGTAGVAGAVEDLLVAEGFGDTQTDNADSFDYEETEIRLMADAPEGLFELIKDALSDYTVTKGEDLDEDSQYDVVIVVGSS